MYHCTQRKIAFFMPTRTGSTTLQTLFNEWGLSLFKGEKHVLLSEAVELLPDIHEYKTYGFFRNPLDRYLSAIRYIQQSHGSLAGFSIITRIPKETIIKMNYDEMTDAIKVAPVEVNFLFLPQTSWFNDNTELLDFDQFDLEVLKLARLFDRSNIKISTHNYTVKQDYPVSDYVKNYVRQTYQQDYELSYRKLGKIYE